MALQGTIGDFGLADIFQLIGIQRKTGALTLARKRESVTIKFLEGSIAAADSSNQAVEDLLGTVLVRTGKISESQLEDALKIQKKTLRRLGHVLVKSNLISEDDLVEALRIQQLQIIYRLFRWRDCEYSFQASESVEYDEQHFTPIGTETILMEGARMVDEWPLIERRIRSAEMVFRRSTRAESLNLDLPPAAAGEIDVDFGFGGAAEAEAEPEAPAVAGPAPEWTAEEAEILALIDGRRTVQGIDDRSRLGEFDTYRILSDLVTKRLIEEVERVRTRTESSRAVPLMSRAIHVLLCLLVLGFAGLGLYTLPENSLTPWKMANRDGEIDRLRSFASQGRLDRIERAVRVFYLDAGEFPATLDLLARNGYAKGTDLIDAWGRPYGYQVSGAGYRLFVMDAIGAPRPELTISRTFTTTQRMMNLEHGPDPGE